MSLEQTQIECDHCGSSFVTTPTRTFLGFQRFTCPNCHKKIIYPLTGGFRVTYWVIAILMLLFAINAFGSGGYAYPGGVGLAIFYAIYKDWTLRKRNENAGTATTELPAIGIALGAVLAIGLAAAFFVPTLSKNSAKQPNIAVQQTSSNASSTQPTYDSEGWTEESTGTANFGPWLNYSPAGTRYYRDANDIIFRVYPPGVKPDAPPANPFGVGDSTDTIPPASTDPPGTLYEMHADGTITKLTPVKGDPFAGQAPQQ